MVEGAEAGLIDMQRRLPLAAVPDQGDEVRGDLQAASRHAEQRRCGAPYLAPGSKVILAHPPCIFSRENCLGNIKGGA